jgi:hypothetical protein
MKRTNYIVNPRYTQARNKDQSLYTKTVKNLSAKWTPVVHPKDTEFMGNVRPNWDRENKKFVFRPDNARSDWGKFPGMPEVISSALLLYRLLVLFTAKVKVDPARGRYKCVWWITLKHKETGELLMFGEWKGAAGIWTRFSNHKELPPTYKADMLELMNTLADPKCPHSYDGLVAGSVA